MFNVFSLVKCRCSGYIGVIREVKPDERYVVLLQDGVSMVFTESELVRMEQGRKTVWIATISHDNGIDIYASETERGAINQVYEFVKDNWFEVSSAGGPKEYPEDQDEAIKEYFDLMFEDEHFDIEEVEVK